MNAAQLVRVGDVLAQERRPIEVDPTQSYEQIGIRSFGKGIFHKPSISGGDLGSKKVFRIREGDFLLNIVFAWEGALAIAGHAENGMVGSHRFPTYVPDRERVDARYLRALFLADEGQRLLAEVSPGSAGRNRTLNRKAFEDLVIGLPDLGQQQRIGDWLDAIAAKTQDLRAAKDRVSKISSALAGSILSALEDSEASVPLGEILTQVRDEVEVEPDGTYRPAGIYSFGRGLFARSPIQGSETKYKKFNRLHQADLVLSRLKGWEGAVTVVPSRFAGLHVSAEYPTFRPDVDRVDPSYLGWLVRLEPFWDELRDKSHGVGARRERVKIARLLVTKIPLPPLDEQRRIGAVGEKLAALASATERGRELSDALVPAAINQVLA